MKCRLICWGCGELCLPVCTQILKLQHSLSKQIPNSNVIKIQSSLKRNDILLSITTYFLTESLAKLKDKKKNHNSLK